MKRSQPRQNRPVCVDLFSGAGGFSEGFRQAGFHTLAATDFDPSAAATFELNHGRYGTQFVLGDITKPATRERLYATVAGVDLDAVIGGPPCQGFSQVRNHDRLINDPRNVLYRHYVSVIERLRPRVFVMENVPGLDNLGGGAVRRQILQDLALDGEYRVESQVVDAAAFGVPQNRLRILFVGARRDLGIEPRFPRSEFSGVLPVLDRLWVRDRRVYRHKKLPDLNGALSTLLDHGSDGLVTAEQAIGDLEWLRASRKLLRKPSNDPVQYESLPLSAYQIARRAGSSELYNADVPSIREDTVRRLNSIPPGGNYRDLPVELARRYLSEKKWGPELGRPELSRRYFFAYRKLLSSHFSWTLNTKADCVYHYREARALTVREFARLHSFDDTYLFLAGDRHSRYRQVGNAVPPLLARAVGATVRKILAEASRARISVAA